MSDTATETACRNHHMDFCECLSRDLKHAKRKKRTARLNGFDGFCKALEDAKIEFQEISPLQLKVKDQDDNYFFVTYYDNGVRWQKRKKVYNFRTKQSLKMFVINKGAQAA